MRILKAIEITEAIARLSVEANQQLGEDVLQAFERSLAEEKSPAGRDIIGQLIENASLARQNQVPMCQDTGLAVVFVDIGQEVHIEGDLNAAIQEGVRKGYREGYLRKSVVNPPVGKRVNTGDNTPAIIHTEIVPGAQVKISIAPKGGGSENMSALKMLKPADGLPGIRSFVLETVAAAGPNPCPPIVLGIGIGGNFEHSALLAKKALLRTLGESSTNPDIAALEKELLEAVNRLGIGPGGLGGEITALAIHIETHPCHIASMPVAININCHAHRHKEVVL